MRYCENENLYLVGGATLMRTIAHGAALTATAEGMP